MSKELNVFKYGFHENSWRHPISAIGQFFRNCRYAWQRATKGYCDWDRWGLDWFYSRLFADSIKSLIPTIGSPAEMPSEEWDKILREMAECFRLYWDEDDSLKNEYEDEFDAAFEQYEKEGKITEYFNRPRTELDVKFLEREKEIYETRREYLHKGLDLLSKYFEDLWD